MIRKLLLFAAMSLAASAMADQKQTVVIQGGKVDNSVRKIAFLSVIRPLEVDTMAIPRPSTARLLPCT